MRKIFYGDVLIGILITSFGGGTSPVTDDSEPLQVLTHKHEKGSYIKAHMHATKERVTSTLQECLVVNKGSIRIDLFGPDKKPFESVTVGEGELFILVQGGHGIHMNEDSELFEFKNGPFVDDKIMI